jgi:hypothetical protein
MTARDHNNLIGIFYFVLAGLQIVFGGFFALIYIIVGGAVLSSASREEDQIVGGVFLGFGLIIGVILLVIGALTLFAGIKVRKERSIGRVLGIIISILVLPTFPLGTALGVYGLWFFLGDVGKNFYAGLSQGYTMPPNPPSPSSWQ